MSNAKVIGVLLGGVCLGGALGIGVTTTLLKKNTKAASVADSGTCSIGDSSAVATGMIEVDGQTFKKEDFPSEVQDQLFQMQNQVYEVSSNLLKEVGLRIALAKDKELNVGAGTKLPELRELLQATKVSEAEMKAFFEANKKSLPPGTTFEQVRPQLEQYMQGQQEGETVRKEFERFEQKGRIKILVEAPVAPLVEFDITGLPFKGAESSNVVIVEASDYLCSHCRTAVEQVEKIVEANASKVKFVQANYALRPAGLSGRLAQGAWCASQQGSEQFWKFHAKAFEVSLDAANPVSPNTDKAFTDTAIKVAQDAAIDVKVFETCLASDESKSAVEAANEKLAAAGVTGTPTFFVNNRKVGSVNQLQAAIDNELERLSSAPSKAN